MKKRNEDIPKYESLVRGVVSRVEKWEYLPLKNFEEAKKFHDAYLVMEGDWGGTIFLSIPMKQIKCSEKSLKRLVWDIDKEVWNEPEGTGIYFERLKVGQGIVGGDGGGLATKSLWVHPRIKNLEREIEEVLNGKRRKLKYKGVKITNYNFGLFFKKLNYRFDLWLRKQEISLLGDKSKIEPLSHSDLCTLWRIEHELAAKGQDKFVEFSKLDKEEIRNSIKKLAQIGFIKIDNKLNSWMLTYAGEKYVQYNGIKFKQIAKDFNKGLSINFASSQLRLDPLPEIPSDEKLENFYDDLIIVDAQIAGHLTNYKQNGDVTWSKKELKESSARLNRRYKKSRNAKNKRELEALKERMDKVLNGIQCLLAINK